MCATVALALLLLAAPAHATFPGKNGKIAYSAVPAITPTPIQGDCGIDTINPDGTGRAALGHCGQGSPAWSPDGKVIAYVDGTSIATINADGSGNRDLYDLGNPMFGLRWSPDGSKFVFSYETAISCNGCPVGDINTFNSDGSGGFANLTNTPNIEEFLSGLVAGRQEDRVLRSPLQK